MTVTPTSTLPIAPGAYTLDRNHSGVFFQIRHLGLSNVRGIFKAFDAGLTVGTTLETVTVDATVDLASVDTNQPDRDAHLLGTDFFNAETHPTMTFRSTRIRPASDDGYALEGDLTINGVTRPVVFDVDFNGSEVFPGDGRTHVGFSASGEIRRADFGVDFNLPLGLGKVALGERVRVDIDVQFVAPDSGEV
jgi:polyisoprenoid-binding protein YceI